MKTKTIDGVKILIEVVNEDLHDGEFIVPDDVTIIGEGAFLCEKEQGWFYRMKKKKGLL